MTEEIVEKEMTEETVQETAEKETVEKAAMQETVKKKRTVTLESSDNVLFEVEVAVALQSETVKHSLDEEEDGCNVDKDAGKVVPLPIVIEYCKKHVESSKSEDGATEDALKEWDKDFVNVDLDALYHLIMAANFMNLKGLHGLTCQRVAHIIHGKTPEEIRQTFGIKNDFTPEEEEEIKKQNQWACCLVFAYTLDVQSYAFTSFDLLTQMQTKQHIKASLVSAYKKHGN
ncbi:SKP1-like protein [Drosera capensis]